MCSSFPAIRRNASVPNGPLHYSGGGRRPADVIDSQGHGKPRFQWYELVGPERRRAHLVLSMVLSARTRTAKGPFSAGGLRAAQALGARLSLCSQAALRKQRVQCDAVQASSKQQQRNDEHVAELERDSSPPLLHRRAEDK